MSGVRMPAVFKRLMKIHLTSPLAVIIVTHCFKLLGFTNFKF